MKIEIQCYKSGSTTKFKDLSGHNNCISYSIQVIKRCFDTSSTTTATTTVTTRKIKDI
jgi:hypothetical protein